MSSGFVVTAFMAQASLLNAGWMMLTLASAPWRRLSAGIDDRFDMPLKRFSSVYFKRALSRLACRNAAIGGDGEQRRGERNHDRRQKDEEPQKPMNLRVGHLDRILREYHCGERMKLAVRDSLAQLVLALSDYTILIGNALDL